MLGLHSVKVWQAALCRGLVGRELATCAGWDSSTRRQIHPLQGCALDRCCVAGQAHPSHALTAEAAEMPADAQGGNLLLTA